MVAVEDDKAICQGRLAYGKKPAGIWLRVFHKYQSIIELKSKAFLFEDNPLSLSLEAPCGRRAILSGTQFHVVSLFVSFRVLRVRLRSVSMNTFHITSRSH